MKQSNKTDLLCLHKIREYQAQLLDEMKHCHIDSPESLDRIRPMVRRGLIQTVGDIFELTKNVSEDTLQNIKIDRRIIRTFRNTASHNYGVITDELAFAIVSYCTSKQLREAIEQEVARLKVE